MFEISRSIKQGCPLLALLFTILLAEILAVSIQKTKKVKRIKLKIASEMPIPHSLGK